LKILLAIIGVLVILVIVGLSGCNSTEQTTGPTPEDLIIGNWYGEIQGEVVNYTFYENDSTCLSYGIKTLWKGYEITKDYLIITNLTSGSSTSYEYSFVDNNQTLGITAPGGEITVLRRR
jgi:hypothetical protein